MLKSLQSKSPEHPAQNILLSGWRAGKSPAFASQDPGLYPGRNFVIKDNARPAEPDTPFPAHLIIHQLMPHAHGIEPGPGNKDHDRDKPSGKGNTPNNPVRFSKQ